MVALLPIGVEDPRLDRLLQLYIHEWSGRIAIPIGPDARFAYDKLDGYRDRETRGVFLFIDRNVQNVQDVPDAQTPLGFGLIMRDAAERWSVEEFFVIAGARRRGVGRAAAQLLFANHRGRWTLTIREENAEALAFWRRAAPGAEEQVEPGADGVVRTRVSFDTTHPPRVG